MYRLTKGQPKQHFISSLILMKKLMHQLKSSLLDLISEQKKGWASDDFVEKPNWNCKKYN